MNCPTCSARLAPAEVTCPACGAALAPLRALLAATAALPREITPPRDLWPSLSAQLSAAPIPRRRAPLLFATFLPLAVAAAFTLLLSVAERRNAATFPRPAWNVAALAGAPRVNATSLAASGQLFRGQWLETDATSRAKVSVGSIGEVTVEPNSRLRLVETSATDHRVELARGTLSAFIWAPPRLFFVNTPSATAVDLGCAYTLAVDDAGNGELRVTSGYVALEEGARESIIPAEFMCYTRRGVGPGTPFAVDAPTALRTALQHFDFPASTTAPAPGLAEILTQARPADAVTLWHLLGRVARTERSAVFDALAAHHTPPADVTRAGIVAGDAAMRRVWAAALGFGQFPAR